MTKKGKGLMKDMASCSHVLQSACPEQIFSLYARLYGSDPASDPYTRTVSDVYQDVFGEGSFIGKGIYDVDIFRLVLNGRFPENRILSHDLLEGLLCQVRTYQRRGII